MITLINLFTTSDHIDNNNYMNNNNYNNNEND